MSTKSQTSSDPIQRQTQLRKKLDDLLQSPSPLSDVILEVGEEGKRIYASRWLLADASETFTTMFAEATDEDDTQVIKINDVSLQTVLEFMHWVMPSTRLPVTAAVAELLLPFVEKFSITKLQEECEAALIVKFQTLKTDEERLKYLILAQSYSLPGLYDVCVNQLSNVPLEKLKKIQRFTEVTLNTMSDLMACRLQLLETCNKQEKDANSDEVTLLVENQPLEVSRYQLMGASPVFKAMLDSGFKEGQSREIVLPEKKYDAVQFMVDYITSGFTTPITDSLLEPTVALADEYLITRLKRDCEEFMMGRVDAASSDDLLLYLHLAQTHNISQLRDKSETLLSEVSHRQLSQCPNYNKPDLGKVLRLRMEHQEKRLEDIGSQAKSKWTEFLAGFDRELQSTCGYAHTISQHRCPGGASNGCDGNRLDKILKFVTGARGTTEQVAPFLKEFLDEIS